MTLNVCNLENLKYFPLLNNLETLELNYNKINILKQVILL